MKGLLICLIGLAFTIGCSSPSANTSSPPEASVSHEPFIYVSGQVLVPNKFPWTNGMTLQDSVKVAGGFTDFASRRLQVTRDGVKTVYRLGPHRTFTDTPPLQPGDMIYCPTGANF
jgi:protein involved in polysaccharide export with SLBB domain